MMSVKDGIKDCGIGVTDRIQGPEISISLLLINWMIPDAPLGDWNHLKIRCKESSGVQKGWRTEGLWWYSPTDFIHWVLQAKNHPKGQAANVLCAGNHHFSACAGKFSRIKCTDCIYLACRDHPGKGKEGETCRCSWTPPDPTGSTEELE